MKKTAVWCVGNALMRDDGVGPALYSELASSPVEHLEAVNCETTPENWIARLRQSPPEVLLIADAADMGLPGGTIRKMSLDDTGNISFSSHGIPLSLILEPFRKEIEIAVIAVQPLERGFGEELSRCGRGCQATFANPSERQVRGAGMLPGETVAQVELPRDFAFRHLLGRPLDDDLSLVDQVRPVRYGKGIPYVVIRQQDAVPLRSQAQDDLLDVIHGNGVDTAEWFVQEEEVRKYGQASRDFNPPALASAERVPGYVRDLLKPEVLYQAVNHCSGRFFGRGILLQYEFKVLPDGEVPED